MSQESSFRRAFFPSLSVVFAVALVACGGPEEQPLPDALVDADAAVVAATDTFDVSISCEAAFGDFVCDVARTGGVGPFSATWTGVTRAYIDVNYLHNPDTVQGMCTPNRPSTVQLSITDALGRNVVRSKSFPCSQLAP
ncbi:hypothetical protein [Pyxidicoccus sp. MSG2]|uniref:hypothetical protein n=1 Tax=Pyxidicoccus sp. MSG2 TaxID=2996790 RepID=UPI00226D88D3|nr:hypothetical protein [Pyxidicoccus sp. MSG2]MCY1023864.1 hypothetical protein [Pyxidicoccus sp. MSG2]